MDALQKAAGTPFRRALSMMAAIAAAMHIHDRAARNEALQNIDPYRSRGKGKSRPFVRSMFSAGATSWCNNGGKGKPHQGARECERRVRQMANGTHGY